jgi:hypothetical protein
MAKQNGGLLKGKSHKNGGIKAVIDGKELVELEGGEYIIPKNIVDKYGTEPFDEIRMDKMEKGGKVKFNQGVRLMEHGGEVTVTNDSAPAGDIYNTHTHSGYKVGK